MVEGLKVPNEVFKGVNEGVIPNPEHGLLHLYFLYKGSFRYYYN
jgi:hypothetical protein